MAGKVQNDNVTRVQAELEAPGEEAKMAVIIEFYVPANHQPKRTAWTPPDLRGKVIEFPIVAVKKSA